MWYKRPVFTLYLTSAQCVNCCDGGGNYTFWRNAWECMIQPDHVIIRYTDVFQELFGKGTYYSATMSDAWEEIQAIKSKRNSLREKLQKRKKERQDILNQSGGALVAGF